MADCKHHNNSGKEKCPNYENCMKMIQAVLDGSASEEEIEHFKANIDTCAPCLEGYNLQKALKDSLHNKIEKKYCPQVILEKIKLKVGIGVVLTLAFLIEYFLAKHIL